MTPIVLCDDPVLVSVITTLLKEAKIESHVFDRHASALLGAVGEAPMRIMVADEDLDPARRLLQSAGLGQWIAGDV